MERWHGYMTHNSMSYSERSKIVLLRRFFMALTKLQSFLLFLRWLVGSFKRQWRRSPALVLVNVFALISMIYLSVIAWQEIVVK